MGIVGLLSWWKRIKGLSVLVDMSIQVPVNSTLTGTWLPGCSADASSIPHPLLPMVPTPRCPAAWTRWSTRESARRWRAGSGAMLPGWGTRRAAPGNRLKVSSTNSWSSIDLIYLLQPLRVRGWLGAGAAWRADTQAPTGSLAEKNLGEMRFVVDIIYCYE